MKYIITTIKLVSVGLFLTTSVFAQVRDSTQKKDAKVPDWAALRYYQEQTARHN